MSSRPANDGKNWSRTELILAFELYCRIPFRRTKASNPHVRELAALLHRTPGSIARKLGNFGAFDPRLQAADVRGLSHGSKLDRKIWDEFHANWNDLVVSAHALRADLSQPAPGRGEADSPSEVRVEANRRLQQEFFRASVLSSYNNRCCMTGLPIRECLIAAHIIPWSIEAHRRADPRNGLCLSATFHHLFDAGLVTVDDDLTVRVSDAVLRLRDQAAIDRVSSIHGRSILLPDRFAPDAACLEWHRKNIFNAA